VPTMQISEFGGNVIGLTCGCVLFALPIVRSSYRIKSLLDCTSSRKRVPSRRNRVRTQSQYATRESL
jgi:hypothetical protein